MWRASLSVLALISGCAVGAQSIAVDVARDTPSAAVPSGFNRDAFYTISTEVDGAEVALTFVVPEGAAPGTLTMSPSSAAVALRPLASEPTQLWSLVAQDVTPGDVFTVYAKISDDPSRLTGVLELQNPDNRFSDSPAYRAEHNRLTVGYYSNENTEYWILKKEAGGKFRILSVLAAAPHLNEPGTEPFATRWNEARSLTAVRGPDGALELRHEPSSPAPGQLWTIKLASHQASR